MYDEMSRDELWKLLHQKEEEIEKTRQKRGIKLISLFFVLYYLLFFNLEKPSGFGLLGIAIPALILSVIHVIFNSIIFYQVYLRADSEDRLLSEIKKRIGGFD